MHREKNAGTLRMFLATVESLPFDTEAAAVYGQVRVMLQRAGTPISERDMLIAAHATPRPS